MNNHFGTRQLQRSIQNVEARLISIRTDWYSTYTLYEAQCSELHHHKRTHSTISATYNHSKQTQQWLNAQILYRQKTRIQVDAGAVFRAAANLATTLNRRRGEIRDLENEIRGLRNMLVALGGRVPMVWPQAPRRVEVHNVRDGEGDWAGGFRAYGERDRNADLAMWAGRHGWDLARERQLRQLRQARQARQARHGQWNPMMNMF